MVFSKAVLICWQECLFPGLEDVGFKKLKATITRKGISYKITFTTIGDTLALTTRLARSCVTNKSNGDTYFCVVSTSPVVIVAIGPEGLAMLQFALTEIIQQLKEEKHKRITTTKEELRKLASKILPNGKFGNIYYKKGHYYIPIISGKKGFRKNILIISSNNVISAAEEALKLYSKGA